jgi:hypothetical protein
MTATPLLLLLLLLLCQGSQLLLCCHNLIAEVLGVVVSKHDQHTKAGKKQLTHRPYG